MAPSPILAAEIRQQDLARIFHDSRGRGAGILDVAKADAENAGNIGKDKPQTEVL
ncbi:MAG: hypothetical protein R3242_10850 [Akkermansiaceae bacterium]|nr:hypothetical protein [Akkermansiaceae bacterium]